MRMFVSSQILNKIRVIKFGCNTKTTQEGRIVKRGKFYDIRINFCLNNKRSLILSEKKKYIEEIRRFGGSVDFETRFVTWQLSDAKLYTFYILFHEISHIIFCENYLDGQLGGKKIISEEQWCDKYSMMLVKKIEKIL